MSPFRHANRSHHLTAVVHAVRRAVVRLRRALDDQRELHERRLLLDRPWEEDFLHWSCATGEWRLHGTLVPPGRVRPGVSRSVTSRGWCPGAMSRRPTRPPDQANRQATPSATPMPSSPSVVEEER